MYAPVKQNVAGLTFCVLFQSCDEGEEEEDVEGKEKTFEVLLISQEYSSEFHFVFFKPIQKWCLLLSFDTGKGNGEAKDAVPASQTT